MSPLHRPPMFTHGMMLMKLIDYAREKAQEENCDRLYWHTQETNKTAQRLYDGVTKKPG